MAEHYHAVTVLCNTSRYFFEQLPFGINPHMKEHAIWREKLKQLIAKLGRGGIRIVAEKIDKSPTYISRMVSDPTTKQHRVVTHETCYLLTKAFPDWLADKSAYAVIGDPSTAVAKLESSGSIYLVRPKTKRQRTIDSLLATIEKINDDGLERLAERAEILEETHPAITKQTRS